MHRNYMHRMCEAFDEGELGNYDPKGCIFAAHLMRFGTSERGGHRGRTPIALTLNPRKWSETTESVSFYRGKRDSFSAKSRQIKRQRSGSNRL